MLLGCGADEPPPGVHAAPLELLDEIPDANHTAVRELVDADLSGAPDQLPVGWLTWESPGGARVLAFGLDALEGELELDIEVLAGGLRLVAARAPRAAAGLPTDPAGYRAWVEHHATRTPGPGEVRREVRVAPGDPQPPTAELPMRLGPQAPLASGRVLLMIELLDPDARVGHVRLARKSRFERPEESRTFSAPDYGRGPVVGRVGIVGDDRRALVLPVGTTRELKLDPAAPELASRSHLYYAVGALAVGGPEWLAPLELELTLATPTTQLATRTWTLDLIEDPAARHWQDAALDWPALGDVTGPLTLSLTARGGRAGDAIAVAGLELIGGLATPRRPNVYLVSLDTVRRDRIGKQGSVGSLTPHLDAFAAESVVFEGATSVAPFTLPAHATVFSGRLPTEHGGQTFKSPIARDTPLIAEELRGVGYATAAFTGGGFLAPDYGLVRGFDRYTIHDPLRTREHIPPRPDVRGSAAAAQALEDWEDTLRLESAHDLGLDAVADWVRRFADTSQFLFLHTYAAHQYQPPQRIYDEELAGTTSAFTMFPEFGPLSDERFRAEPPSAADVEHMRKLYDASVRHADEEFGRFLALLEDEGLAEDSYVVVFSDHGEQLFEHEQFGHSNHVWETLLAVPLMVRGPGIEPAVVPEPVSLLDLGPTLARFAGLEPDPESFGRSLFLRTEGGWQVAGHPVLSEAGVFSEVRRGNVNFDSLVLGQHKLIRRYVEEGVVLDLLFDLAADPGETQDLAMTEPELLARLVERLEAWRALADARAAGATSDAELTDATRAQLEALGYL